VDGADDAWASCSRPSTSSSQPVDLGLGGGGLLAREAALLGDRFEP